jgi:hypothetical protein
MAGSQMEATAFGEALIEHCQSYQDLYRGLSEPGASPAESAAADHSEGSPRLSRWQDRGGIQ